MALIICPECKREISDRVTACPHCGYPITETQEDGPAESSKAQPVEVTSIKIGASHKKKATIIAISTLIIVAIAIGAYFVNQAQQKAAAETAHDAYIDNLELARSVMLISAIESEDLAELTHDVWYNTIYEERSSRTDKYTKDTHYGVFRMYDDFNDSLASLAADKEIKDKKKTINTSADYVKDIMKDLQQPTEEFKDCYTTLNELYTTYNGLVTLATNPTGSLSSYTESYRKYDSDFLSAYNRLDLQIPEKFNKDVPASNSPAQ